MNLYLQLRALLPAPPLLIGTVLETSADGWSTVELPLGIATTPMAPGLATGSTMRARGTQVPVGSRAFVRGGVIESEAPSGAVIESVVGVVVAQPLGPAPLTAGDPAPAQDGKVGVPFSLALQPAVFTGGWPPVVYSVATGALPAGLTLDSATGLVSGTPSAAGAVSVTFGAVDTTHRSRVSGAVVFTIAP